ncbi:hypothetical protein [Streptomyces anthocyanicus]|uniref:hypothetical protein n=1 Tax=Streptomyces anthocyanicus TaxID=68174 RepID=UPI00380F6A17
MTDTKKPKQPPRRRRVAPQVVAAPLPGGVPELTPEAVRAAEAATAVPDTVSQSGTPSAADAAATVPAQNTPEPGPTVITGTVLEGQVEPSDPVERLGFFEEQVFAARQQLQADIQVFEDRLQKPLFRIKHEKLWKQRLARNSKPFRSWAQYVEERLEGISLATADRIIVHVPIERALGSRTSVRQDEVLWPIYRDHGPEMVVKTWNEASALGRPTPANLRVARDRLKLGSDERLDVESTPRPGIAPVERAEAQISRLARLPLDDIRSRTPDQAKRLAAELRDLAAKLETPAGSETEASAADGGGDRAASGTGVPDPEAPV